MTDSKTKCLILFSNKEQEKIFKNACEEDKEFTKKFKEYTRTFTTGEQFTEGKKETRFDIVISYVDKSQDTDDLEMLEDFYNHYSTAPVFFWVIDPENNPQEICEKLAKGSVCINIEGTVPATIAKCLDLAQEKKKKVLEDDVKPAFTKIDKDGSGAIDKSELGELSAALGNPLDEEQLIQALKDLDLNGDGVIDLSEFSKWYLSGMKPLGGGKRAYKRAQIHGKNLLTALSDQSKKALLGKNLKVKKHDIRVGLNSPGENYGTLVEASIYPMGINHEKICDFLSTKYADTENPKFEKTMVNRLTKNYAEISFRMQQGKAEGAAKNLQAGIDTFWNFMIEKNGPAPFSFKVTSKDDYVSVGFGCSMPIREFKKCAIPLDIQDVFRTVDQGISKKLKLKASIKDIMTGDEGLATHMMKGFEVDSEMKIVSNIKDALLEFLKDAGENEKLQKLMGIVMIAAPAFMIQLSGRVNIEFDDMESVNSHPMAGPFLASFTQLFEGALGDKSEMSKKIDIKNKDEGSRAERKRQTAMLINALHDLFGELEDGSEGHVEVRLGNPDLGMSAYAQVKTAGLKDLLTLALMANPLAQEMREFVGEEE